MADFGANRIKAAATTIMHIVESRWLELTRNTLNWHASAYNTSGMACSWLIGLATTGTMFPTHSDTGKQPAYAPKYPGAHQ